MKHVTPAPWHVILMDTVSSAYRIVDRQGASVATWIGHDDARRIVACVNACDGFTDKQLADFGTGTFPIKTALKNAVTRQTDAEIMRGLLRDALAGVLEVMNKDKDGDYFICSEAEQIVANAHAVLAKETT